MTEGCSETVEAGKSRSESGPVLSVFPFPVRRPNNERGPLEVLGDLWAVVEGSRDMALKTLGVGLVGRGNRLFFDPRAALMDD